MTDADGEQIFLADGKFRVVEESDEMRVSVSSKFIGSNMTVEFRIEYLIKPSPQIPEDLIPTKILSIYTLDAAGNLKMTTTVYNKNDQVMTSDTTIDTKN